MIRKLLAVIGAVAVGGLVLGGSALASPQTAPKLNMHRTSAHCWGSNTLGDHNAKICYNNGAFKMTVTKKPPACTHCTTAHLTAASTPLQVFPRSGPHSDQCFGKGHRDGVAKPGATCWEGGIGMLTPKGDFYCMATASRSGVHIVTLNTPCKRSHNDWEAKLVGYVTNHVKHGHDWPNFGNPLLNEAMAGYPVLNIHLVVDGKIQSGVCIGGVPAAFGLPQKAEVSGYGSKIAPTCSPVGQGKPNTHDTFMIWHPGLDTKEEPILAQIVVVNYTKGETGTNRIVLTGADSSGDPETGTYDEVWYVVWHHALHTEQDWYRVRLPEHHHSATAVLTSAMVHPSFVAAGHSGCSWRARGKHEFITYAYLRMIRDTCQRVQLRIRIAGECSVAGWHDGNWIDKIHQLTSVSCPAGQGYTTIVYQYQYWWPKSASARHHHKRGRVHQVILQ